MNPSFKRALQELAQGNLVILTDLRGQGKLLGLADQTTPEMINFMITKGKGLVSVGIEEKRAQQLDVKLQEQSQYSHEGTQAFTVSVDIEETTTGISAPERYQTIAALIDSSRKAEEFKRPGHIFPVIAHQEGIFGNQSHTELGIELAKQVDAYPAVVLCDVLNKNGQLANMKDLKALASEYGIFLLNAEDVIQGYIEREKVVKKIEEKKVTNFVGDFKLRSYSNALDSHVDYVFFSSTDRETTSVYVHEQCSQCHTMACSCHHDFQRALSHIKTKGGICLQIGYRDNSTDDLTQVLDKDVTAILTTKILKDVGIKDFQFIKQNVGWRKEGESLEERAI